MSIIVSGSLVYDHIMNFPGSFKKHILPDQIHKLNVAFAVNNLEINLGGTAGNIAYSMKLLGGNPILVSALGENGERYLKHLRKNKINTKYIKIDQKKESASCYITTDENQNQITAFFGGPLSLAKKVDLKKIQSKITLISPTNKDVMLKHAKECKEAGIKVVFDPGQQITSFSSSELKKMLSLSYAVIGNEYEMKLLQKNTGLSSKEILKKIKVLITTLAEKGSLVETADGQKIKTKSCKPKLVLEPTGAGDAYRAGFFRAFELGYNWKTCSQIGSVCATYVLETTSPQAHHFSKKKFCKRYFKTYKERIKL